MDLYDTRTAAKKTVSALGRGFLLILVLPLIAAIVLGYPVLPVLVMIGTALLLESTAATLGIAFGFAPVYVFLVLVSTESGIFLCLYDIFETIGHSSPRVAAFLEKSRQYADESPVVKKYGILGLVPCEILIGVYANAPLAWVLGWREDRSLLLTLVGYIPMLLVTIWIANGLLHLDFLRLVTP